MKVTASVEWHLKAAANMRGRWPLVKKAKTERQLGLVLVRQAELIDKPQGQPMAKPPCVVTLTRIAPRRLDDDNLPNAFKSIRDGIADALGATDDSARAGIVWRYDQDKGEPNYYGVVMEIEYLPAKDEE